MKLNKRETATTLAALRLYQSWLAGDLRGAKDIEEIDPEPLEQEQIDELCGKINFDQGVEEFCRPHGKIDCAECASECPDCEGTGDITDAQGDYKPCAACNGTGERQVCPECECSIELCRCGDEKKLGRR